MARPLGRLRRALALAAVLVSVASVAGCVGMPGSGPVGTFSASPQDTAPADNIVGPFPSGPGPGWAPREIVQGFLAASASYPADAAIARQYLAAPASGRWRPGWSVRVFSSLTVPSGAEVTAGGRHRPEQAVVVVTGAVQATFNGTGQYVAAQGQGKPAAAPYPFRLVKTDGQWRITNPPPYRMLTKFDFPQVYKAQDLYFFDPTDRVLVPDSVFVPQDTTPGTLLTNLVNALIRGPQTPWLADATDTGVFPSGTTVLSVTPSGDVAVVNLGGALAHASPAVLERVSAELVWTLTGSLGGPQNIQAVELMVNGRAVPQPATGCGPSPSQNPVQKLAAYQCYSPFPSAPSSFSYVNGGQAWSRCGWETKAQLGLIGTVVPLSGHGSAQPCSFMPHESPAAPPAQPPWLPVLSMVAVSPDGRYVAGVSARYDTVYIRQLAGGATSTAPLGPGITALSWDREDDLWVAQGGGISVVSPDGQQADVTFPGSGEVTGLSVAPDGVRVALIVQNGRQAQVVLAAITRGAPPTARSPGPHDAIGSSDIQLGPTVAEPVALTWYDADDLIVLGSGSRLYDVPADGQQASSLEPAPPGAVSVTADSPANALVVGMSGGGLAVSAGLDGSWQQLGGHGQAPAYQLAGLPAPASALCDCYFPPDIQAPAS
ncbi:MAG: GerMN domain-containing protein [Streptosporangiaceae bacterium]|nr:GerMN domain-containing protein [Streptosporangiaceae bacterium]